MRISPGRSAQLRRKHPEDVEEGVAQREAREPLDVAGVRELDRCLAYLAAPIADDLGHDLDHCHGLAGVRVVDEQNARLRGAHCRSSERPAQPLSTVMVPDWTLPWMVQWYVSLPAVLGFSA